MASKQKVQWACNECGYAQTKWSGCCSQCHSWNTFVEEAVVQKNEKFVNKSSSSKPMRLDEITHKSFQRIFTKIREFDRLLGNGIVEGSLILVGGEPGIGKSTLMLQLSHALSKQGLTVLYICGEESAEQTSLRAHRLKVRGGNLYLLHETVFSSIQVQIEQLKPDIVILDSVQIAYKSELPSAPGSVVQVREIATEFMHLAKGQNITTFLIGHVTKSGEIAGPRVLEHLVDTVLEFEGDRQHGFRLLRSLKNRFGPSDDIAIFQMKEEGLQEVPNPSQAFLEERTKELAGAVIVPAMEGVRSFLIEVQALVTGSVFSTPTRRSTGLDQNRLALLLAVLEKRVGYQMHHCDVFVSVAGGVRIVEPAIDLGILLAVASSFSNRIIDSQTLLFGEVGLGGEVRAVTRAESRIKEAIHMGFKKCILPKRNLKGVSASIKSKIQLIGIDIVDEAINEVF